jgi:hypothetical protein
METVSAMEYQERGRIQRISALSSHVVWLAQSNRVPWNVAHLMSKRLIVYSLVAPLFVHSATCRLCQK